jgi:hypothetical protein
MPSLEVFLTGFFQHRGPDKSGGYGVNPNVVFGPFIGQALGQCIHTTFDEL